MEKVKWGIVLQLWWWYAWRSMLFAVLGAGVLGFIIGFILGMAGVQIPTIQLISGIVGAIFGAWISFMVLRSMLNRQYKKFRVVVEEVPAENQKTD